MTRFRGLVLAGVAAAAMLVPLYGDPRQSPVTHPEWARLLLRALDLEQVIGPGGQASIAFQALSWRTSAGYRAENAFRSDGVTLLEGQPRLIQATASPAGEVAFRVAATRPGDYRVRLVAATQPAAPIAAELRREGDAKPSGTSSVAPAEATPDRVLLDAGTLYMNPGLYALSLSLPQGAVLERVEVVPPCVNSIEPEGGWRPTAVATTADVALTVLKAADLEYELPPAAAPITVPVGVFQPLGAQVLTASFAREDLGYALRAAAPGLQAVAQVDLPEPGLYTVYAFGLAGGGQSWVADSCHKSVVCPSLDPSEAPKWRPILTTEFAAGRHSLGVTLGNGAVVERLRFERKKSSTADYLATLARLGLDLGEPAAVRRGQALDAVKFIEAKRREAAAPCGDVVLPGTGGTLVAGLAQPAGGQFVPPGQVAPPGNPGVGIPPIGGPVTAPPPSAPPAVPSQPPGSPVLPIP